MAVFQSPKVGDIIRLVDISTFSSLHSQNREIAETFKNSTGTVAKVDSHGDIRQVIINGKLYGYGIYQSELMTCFEYVDDSSIDESGYGSFKIIITYQDGNTIEEEGVTGIDIKPSYVGYEYNRKKFGFLKYKGEVSLELKDLKQITISTPSSERVFHIEDGIVIREHVMYDKERKFKSYRIGG